MATFAQLDREPLAEHVDSFGLNIAPGHEDDGWISPEPVSLTDGSVVQLYKDGEALHAAYEAIKEAKQRICLEMYIFGSDETGRAFANLLSEKARQGLQVYVIYDSFGSIASDGEMFDQMRRAGVKVQEFHPFWPWKGKFSWRPVNRDHRKLLVIDNDIAWLGGLNLSGEYAGSWVVKSSMGLCDLWRDNAIGIKGAVARKFLQCFAKTWYYVTRRGRLRNAEFVYNLDGICGACEWPIRKQRKRGTVLRGEEPRGEGQLGILASAASAKSAKAVFEQAVSRRAAEYRNDDGLFCSAR